MAGAMAEAIPQLIALRANPAEVMLFDAKPVHQLHDFPRGPMVPLHSVKRPLKAAYAEMIDPTEAHAVIGEANALRLEADPGDRTVTIIKLAKVPPPLFSRTTTFWEAAFAEACLHGPRMLAALLLVVSETQFPDEAKEARAKLLKELRSP
jgi:hypothetical protein